jgi:periplasmic divalent cation tolerance protein
MNLSKCVQVDSVMSFFKWDDKLLTENEFRVMIKAESDKYKLIEEAILKLHNYQLPQIIKIDITDGLPNYLKWLGNE